MIFREQPIEKNSNKEHSIGVQFFVNRFQSPTDLIHIRLDQLESFESKKYKPRCEFFLLKRKIN